MTVWTIIPVKPFNRAKSRLASVLSPAQRATLAEEMFRRVVTVARSVPQVSGCLVISRDSYVLSLARELGANTVAESGAPELNNALIRATEVIKSWGAGAVLILPADLPLLAATDITEVIKLGTEDRSVVLATDHDSDGTNVLFTRPPGMFPYHYGPDSLAKHRALAEQAGATVHLYRSERTMLDIDTALDIKRYEALTQQGTYDMPPLVPTDNAEQE